MAQTIIKTLDEKLELDEYVFSDILDVSKFFIPAEIYTSYELILSPYKP